MKAAITLLALLAVTKPSGAAEMRWELSCEPWARDGRACLLSYQLPDTLGTLTIGASRGVVLLRLYTDAHLVASDAVSLTVDSEAAVVLHPDEGGQLAIPPRSTEITSSLATARAATLALALADGSIHTIDLALTDLADLLSEARRATKSDVGGSRAGLPILGAAAACRDIAAGSYSLERLCIEGEEKAYDALRVRAVEPRIMDYCTSIVVDSYSLLKICIDQEEDAKAALGR